MMKKPQKTKRKVEQFSISSEETQNLSEKTSKIDPKVLQKETEWSLQGRLEMIINLEQEDNVHFLIFHFNNTSDENEQLLRKKLIDYIVESTRQWKTKNKQKHLSGFVLIQCQVNVLETSFRKLFCYELCHLVAEYIIQIGDANNPSLTVSLPDFSNCQIQYLTNLNQLNQTAISLDSSFTPMSNKELPPTGASLGKTTLPSSAQSENGPFNNSPPQSLEDSGVPKFIEEILAIRSLANSPKEIVDTLIKLEEHLKSIRMAVGGGVEDVFNQYQGQSFDATTTRAIATLMDRIAKSLSLRFLCRAKSGEEFLSSVRAGMVNSELYRFRFESNETGKQKYCSSSNSLPESILRLSDPDPRRSKLP